MQQILTAQNVNDIFLYCLFDDDEQIEDPVFADGVMVKVGFNKTHLTKKEPEIVELLNQLPEKFFQNKGGGWSFLNACYDKYENQWASFHASVDELLCLGLAIDKVGYNMPRSLWPSLPGGMPYFYVKN